MKYIQYHDANPDKQIISLLMSKTDLYYLGRQVAYLAVALPSNSLQPILEVLSPKHLFGTPERYVGYCDRVDYSLLEYFLYNSNFDKYNSFILIQAAQNI